MPPVEADAVENTIRRRERLAEDLFIFLSRKYVQTSDSRQRTMGLQYTTAETHDLAKEIANFVDRSYRVT